MKSYRNCFSIMGGKVSSLSSLSENTLLYRFVGNKHVPYEEESFWDEFLAFKFTTPIVKSDTLLLKEAVQQFCQVLSVNNKSTGNFSSLCRLLIHNVRDLIADESRSKVYELCLKCHNALLIIRMCCEYFIENIPEDILASQFNTISPPEDQPTILEETLLSLSEILSYILVDESTYYMHLEAVSLLVVLLSSQMLDVKVASLNQSYVHLMESRCSSNATLVVRKLIHNYIKNDVPPPTDQGFVGWAASGLLSFLGTQPKSPEGTIFTLNPLGSHSLLLLLLICFQHTKENNPYRHALMLCRPGKSSQIEKLEKEVECSFTLNFKRLYGALARDLQNDHGVLLLYLLLHRNSSFLAYALQQKDLECLIGPILQVLYNAEQKNPHHMYMALIVILIFSQQEEFNSVIHELPVENVSWYKEKNLNGISLGSLIVLIVLRTIQFNMARMRDKYLHTNCLASLANMASSFKFLHTFVTQKLIMLFNHLMKRHTKLSEKNKDANNQLEEIADLAVLEEIVHMMLEIINACLYNHVSDNSNLIFALLRNKEVFESFSNHPKFQKVIENIYSILTYFGNCIDELAPFNNADEIIALIVKKAENCPREQLQKLPQLKFKYLEEEAAEEFFVPYIWSIIFKTSFIHWDNTKIKLFNTI